RLRRAVPRQLHQPVHDAPSRRRHLHGHAGRRGDGPHAAPLSPSGRRRRAGHRPTRHVAPATARLRLMADPLARRITRLEVRDVRFPTSRALDGSDAMNADPDYSATYVVLHTDATDGIEGHGLTFTIGRGNELCVAAVEALAPLVLELRLDDIAADMGAFWRRIVGDTQLRWVGP